MLHDNLPHQFICLVHRKKVQQCGKKAVQIYDKMAYAPTLEDLDKIKISVEFHGLTECSIAATTGTYSDATQFLATCVAEERFIMDVHLRKMLNQRNFLFDLYARLICSTLSTT